MDNLTKLTVNLIPEAVIALDQAADIANNSKTDTVNRALQVYAFLVEKQREGWRFIIKNTNEEKSVKFD
jgi:hypothetical protein